MAPEAQKENKMIYNHLGNTGLRVCVYITHAAAFVFAWLATLHVRSRMIYFELQ